MKPTQRIIASTLTLLALSCLGNLAQGTGAQYGLDQSTTRSLMRGAHGVQPLDGDVLLGMGPDYEVRFHPTHVTYTPALGRDVEQEMPLTFRVESIRRGAAGIPIVEAATPTRDGTRVEYQRGAVPWPVIERYDVRAGGVEQSFVFEALPAGSGDLVVRSRIDSDLLPSATGRVDDGLRYELPDIGGVSIGGVTVFDAAGEHVRGGLRIDGEHLELIVPASFVDRAALPLVIDPIIGTHFVVSGSFDDTSPDVAYDASTDSYLVVWQRDFSAASVRIRGQLIDWSGNPLHGLLAISSSAVGLNPSVANVNSRNRFLVAWQQGPSVLGPWDIAARSVDPAASLLSSVITVTGAPGNQVTPDVGGEATVSDDEALVIWSDTATGIRGAQVNLPTSPLTDPTAFSSFTISKQGSFTDARPAISKSGGSTGRYLVVWERDLGTEETVRAQTIDRNGTLLGKVSAFAGAGNERRPDVDGNGTEWMAVYQKEEAPGSLKHDVYCRRLQYVDSFGVLATVGAETAVDSDYNDNETDPTVAFAGSKYMVAWADEWVTFLARTIGYIELDVEDCSACYPPTGAASGAQFAHGEPVLVAEISGDPKASDRGLLVWETLKLAEGFEGDILARRVEAIASGGPIKDLGGGCGNGGTLLSVGEAAIGNKDFRLTLSGAPIFHKAALLNVALPGTPTKCGSCKIVPIQFLINIPVSKGKAVIPLPIPCEPSFAGASVQFQFLVSGSGATPCPSLSGLSFSNGLQFTLGY